jgi:hypothetical protein
VQDDTNSLAGGGWLKPDLERPPARKSGRRSPRSGRLAVLVAGLFVSLLTACGGVQASPAIRNCVSLWNAAVRENSLRYPQFDAQHFASAGGAALVLEPTGGGCTVLLGAAGKPPAVTSGNVFVYVDVAHAYEASTSLGGLALPSSWNARPNSDGTLSPGRP